jgi:PadR family transcriptional regulator PadR
MPGKGHRRRGGRSRRAARLLQPTLLLLLHQGSSHGYALLERLDEFGLGEVDPSAVYRALRDMETRAWVSSLWDDEQTQGPPRRLYHLTPLGDEMLSAWVGDLADTQQIIAHLMSSYREHMRQGTGDHH